MKHTQIIKFVDGSKKTIKNIVDITEGDFVKLTTDKGLEYLINSKNVLWVIRGVTSEDQEKQTKKPNLTDEEDYEDPVSENYD